MDQARHHIFPNPLSRVALDADPRLLVHTAAKIADIPLELDVGGRAHAHRESVPARGIENPPDGSVGLRLECLECGVQLANGHFVEIDVRPAPLSSSHADGAPDPRIVLAHP